MRTAPLAMRPLGFAARLARIVAAVLGAACEADDMILLPPPSPVILPSQYVLAVGDTLRIRATYNGRACDCLWATADESRAVVAASGLVRGLTPGWVTVTATYRLDPNAKASALVQVIAP